MDINMNEKISIEQANPFVGIEHTTHTIDNIMSFKSKIVFKSDNGPIVELQDDETGLLYTSESEDIVELNAGDEINILYEENGLAVKDSGKFALYQEVLTKAKNGQVFNADVVSSVQQGLLMSINGLQCFLPEGQIGLEKRNDLRSFVGEVIDVKLVSIKLKEKEWNRFLPIVSHKILEDEKKMLESRDKLQDLKVGSIITGVVKSIVSYGVFVTLFPSVDGLIHITDLSWDRISDPSELLYVGQNINVIVLDINQKDNGEIRISLGLKQLTTNPWDMFYKNNREGEIVSGAICAITDYGIFVLLDSGVQGLVQRTELSWDKKVKPNDFQKGQFVTAKIIYIDSEKERIQLSIKQTQTDPWDNINGKLVVGDIIETTISNITNFGIFVTILDGIEGLIHVSELSWIEIINNPQDYYSLGDHLNAAIISIDMGTRKIALSHKRILPNPWQTHSVGQHVNAIILDIGEHGIQVKLEKDNLPAFIPAKFVKEDYSQNGISILECIIQEIDEDKRRIILSIA